MNSLVSLRYSFISETDGLNETIPTSSENTEVKACSEYS